MIDKVVKKYLNIGAIVLTVGVCLIILLSVYQKLKPRLTGRLARVKESELGNYDPQADVQSIAYAMWGDYDICNNEEQGWGEWFLSYTPIGIIQNAYESVAGYIESYGVDTGIIKSTLQGKSKDQLGAIFNRFHENYPCVDLFKVLNEELSEPDRTQILEILSKVEFK